MKAYESHRIARPSSPPGVGLGRRGFRPLNTLASPVKPRFHNRTTEVFDLSSPGTSDSESDIPFYDSPASQVAALSVKLTMVRERSPSRGTAPPETNAAQTPSSRPPLANISAKMQSNSPNRGHTAKETRNVKSSLKQPEFGKASPLRNPLDKSRPKPNIFVPKRPVPKPVPSSQAGSQRAANMSSASGAWIPRENRTFYLPGQREPQRQASSSAALSLMDDYADVPVKRPVAIQVPTNSHLETVERAPRATFSTLGSNTSYQPWGAPAPPPPTRPKQIVDLTTRDSDDEFDPDSALQVNDNCFGAPDPYMYVDAAQASENIKNLLEGAFDDEDDKSKTRLRKRAQKPANGAAQQTKSLADRLAALDVKEDTPAAPEEEEQEDGTVEGLEVKLLPHQVEGVGWMIDKEIGQRKKNGILPHGGILADDMGLGKTVQSIALILTNPRPAADAKPEHPKQKLPGKEVGKGTLVVAPLALIKQWESEIKTKVTRKYALKVLVHHGPSRTKSSIELSKYDVVITTYQTLTSEHAGSNMGIANGPRIGCFGVHWYRIMLDEAHSIKNRNAKSTQACCTLNSWYRWCLTGTPMQNNLDELQSLIKFLRIKPYCEFTSWKTQIIGPIKAGRGWLGMRRLQLFLKAFMKRRTKDVLKQDGALNFGGKSNTEGPDRGSGMQIVKREVLTVECEFDQAEQEFYDRLRDRADKRLKDMTKEGKKADYMGALVLLLRLRQVCDHPHLIEYAMSKDRDALTTGTAITSDPQTPSRQSKSVDADMDDLAALMGGVSVQAKNCDVCQVELSMTKSRSGASRCNDCQEDLMWIQGKQARPKARKPKHQQSQSRHGRHVLPDDSDEEENDEDAEGGGESLATMDSERSDEEDSQVEDSPSRARHQALPSRKVRDSDREEISGDDATDRDEDDEHTDDESSEDENEPTNILSGLAQSSATRWQRPSTKVRHLLRILHAEAPEHKTIVFSQFTTMLDLIEPHLFAAGLKFVRYDGSMRNDAREAALHSLRTDPKTRVLLCSLKCGSLGLNLTAASRVVIVEPFWNPFVEEQAIDRVHRLNQTVDVKVFRLTVAGSVEERILALQEKKRELAKAAIEGGKTIGKLSMKDILSLFGRDAHQPDQDEEEAAMWQKYNKDGTLLGGPSNSSKADRDGAGDSPRAGAKHGGRAREHEVYGRRW